MVAKRFYDFQLNHDRVIDYEIGGIFADNDIIVAYDDGFLLDDRQAVFPYFDCERVLVNLFEKSHALGIRHSERAPNDPFGQAVQRGLIHTYPIHLSSSAVKKDANPHTDNRPVPR